MWKSIRYLRRNEGRYGYASLRCSLRYVRQFRPIRSCYPPYRSSHLYLRFNSQSRPLQVHVLFQITSRNIIFATGFRPSSSSSILPSSLLSALSFSETDHFLPILLHRATLHPSLPNAAFVGHYRGPFWGIIELQARWCAGLFCGSLPWPSSR